MEENNSLIEENNLLVEKNKLLNDEISENNRKNESYDYTYVQTYRYIEDYKYIVAADPMSMRYLVVDKFQEFKPTIITVYKSVIDVELKKDSIYEFTFQTRIINNQPSEIVVVTRIEETDKTGFEQIQEPAWPTE